MNVEEFILVISSCKIFDFIHYVKMLGDQWDHCSLENYSHVTDVNNFLSFGFVLSSMCFSA